MVDIGLLCTCDECGGAATDAVREITRLRSDLATVTAARDAYRSLAEGMASRLAYTHEATALLRILAHTTASRDVQRRALAAVLALGV